MAPRSSISIVDGDGVVWYHLLAKTIAKRYLARADGRRLLRDLPPLAAPGGVFAPLAAPAPGHRLEDRQEARRPSRSPRRVVLNVKVTNAPDWSTEA